jgi:hypothetical protein
MGTGVAVDITKGTRQVLARAAVRLGGVEALASRLEISQRVLKLYIEGNEAVPDSLLLRVIDLILEEVPDPGASQPGSHSLPTSVPPSST